jgi:hypothetical protein
MNRRMHRSEHMAGEPLSEHGVRARNPNDPAQVKATLDAFAAIVIEAYRGCTCAPTVDVEEQQDGVVYAVLHDPACARVMNLKARLS